MHWNKNIKKECMCTILLISYNHEKYIEKSIKSVLSQKTKHNYKIHIFDDASTDNTLSIIKKYEKKYPEKIKVFTTEINHGSQTNMWNAYRSVDTKYCCFMETDDYWCDDERLELQINALEENHNCSFCCGNTFVSVEKDEYLFHLDNKNFVQNNTYKKQIISLDDIKNMHGFQTHISSRIFRIEVVDFNLLKSHKEAFLHDAAQFFYLLSKGDMYWVNRTISVYCKTGKGAVTSASPGERVQLFLIAMTDLNFVTKYKLWNLIGNQILIVVNYWLKQSEKNINHLDQNNNKKNISFYQDAKQKNNINLDSNKQDIVCYDYKLFGIVPVYSVITRGLKKKVKLLGITILSRYKVNDSKIKYKLFGVIPFLKVKLN